MPIAGQVVRRVCADGVGDRCGVWSRPLSSVFLLRTIKYFSPAIVDYMAPTASPDVSALFLRPAARASRDPSPERHRRTARAGAAGQKTTEETQPERFGQSEPDGAPGAPALIGPATVLAVVDVADVLHEAERQRVKTERQEDRKTETHRR